MTPTELQAWRQTARLSQAGLSALLGVDKQTIWRWEKGRRVIPPFLEMALAELRRSLAHVGSDPEYTASRASKKNA